VNSEEKQNNENTNNPRDQSPQPKNSSANSKPKLSAFSQEVQNLLISDEKNIRKPSKNLEMQHRMIEEFGSNLELENEESFEGSINFKNK
jgi:hypothetical protein